MIKQTSIDIYHKSEAMGIFKGLRLRIYKVICYHGPLTQAEVHKNYFPEYQLRSITPRFSEIERQGGIKVVGERACRVNKNNAEVWDSTNEDPIKLEKPEREKCKACDGKGYIETSQGKLF